jgi:hypothetical protein
MCIDNVLKKYVGIKLFEEEQKKFKEEFFKELFDPYIEVDYSKRTTLYINAVLEEKKIPYLFAIKTEVEDENKGKRYWILIEL